VSYVIVDFNDRSGAFIGGLNPSAHALSATRIEWFVPSGIDVSRLIPFATRADAQRVVESCRSAERRTQLGCEVCRWPLHTRVIERLRACGQTLGQITPLDSGFLVVERVSADCVYWHDRRSVHQFLKFVEDPFESEEEAHLYKSELEHDVRLSCKIMPESADWSAFTQIVGVSAKPLETAKPSDEYLTRWKAALAPLGFTSNDPPSVENLLVATQTCVEQRLRYASQLDKAVTVLLHTGFVKSGDDWVATGKSPVELQSRVHQLESTNGEKARKIADLSRTIDEHAKQICKLRRQVLWVLENATRDEAAGD
jgi:uncharacterized coiled-coil protein SlyX